MNDIIHLSPEGFRKVTSADGKVLVDFFATWCGPCRNQSRILEEMAEANRFPADVRITKLDIDQAPEIASAFNVEVVPTLILFQNGKAVKRSSGVHNESALLEFLK